MQELRIKRRWDAIQQANDEMEEAKLKGENYIPFRYHNGDTAMFEDEYYLQTQMEVLKQGVALFADKYRSQYLNGGNEK